ncbi:MAG: hypothetical protein EPN21_05200 [Methylococcaceae bacterium]|nr:MAG: hypothetical protein EPN21_05200 [Methylococcaceae bacterium]
MSSVLHPQYITDETGKRISVVLSFEEYEKYQELLEDMDDLSVIAERRNEAGLAHVEVIAGLQRDGLL